MIRFAAPYMVILFIPWLLIAVWHFYRQRKIIKTLLDLGNDRVQHFLLGRLRIPRQQVKLGLFYLGLGFLLIGATGPQIGTKIVELEQQGVDILFLLDTSVSMDARDVAPSRIEKAKYEIGQLISKLHGDRVGMIVFAGTAHLHFPLTSDYAAARLFLNSVDTRLVQFQGTVISDGLRLAIDSFDPDSDEHKTVVLISDGEDHDGRALALAQQVAETGIIINVVGVGSHAGAPIPINGGSEFKKDKSSRVITTTLNERALKEIATAGNGSYTRVDNRIASLSGLLDEIQSMRKRTLRSQEFSQFEDRFQLFLIPAFIFLLIEFILPEGRRENPQARRRFEV